MSGKTKTKKPVQIRITEERKRRWKREAEERVEYRSLTDLVVAGVENELRDDPVVGGVDVDLDGVHERLDSIRGEMREMGDTVDETYLFVRKDEAGDYTDLTSRIQDLVPLGDREKILKRTPEKAASETAAVSGIDRRRTGAGSAPLGGQKRTAIRATGGHDE